MTLHTYPELEQGTEEWLAARCGILTASTIGRLITPTLKVANNDTSRSLTVNLAAERITGHVEPTYQSNEMFRGVIEEPLARNAYAEHHDVEVAELGFMVRDFGGYRIGFSPDGLVGDNGLIEIKSRAQKKQVLTVLADEVPAENMGQLQTGLLVSGRDWIDYVSYASGMALWTKRVYPDPAWQSAIVAAAQQFEAAAQQIVADYTAAVEGLPVMERVDHFAEITF